MNLHWPQLTLIALTFISFGIQLAQHGKQKTGNESAWVELFGNAITLSLLWAGGFFRGGC